eukprot:XP_012810650.1 PREDICTED: myosin-IIIb-like [Xenopus tropicalis]
MMGFYLPCFKPLSFLLTFQATDVSFVEKLNSTYRESPLYERGRGFEPGFAIHHYAGKIKYSAAGFLEKNRDALPTNINRLFISSETSLISILFTASISRTGTLTPQQRAKVKVSQEKGSSRKISVGAQFRHSLAVLMEKMYLAEPHFIRCIKPNSQNEPGLLETQTVLNQSLLCTLCHILSLDSMGRGRWIRSPKKETFSLGLSE